MAKAKKSTTTDTGQTKVTRITAKDTPAVKKTAKKTITTPVETPGTETKTKTKRRNPLRASTDYFVGAWYELRQVRWPNRRATWGMTAALLAFTTFFVIIILLLDALFKYLFQLIIG